MENLKHNIFDMVSEPEITFHRSNLDAFSNQDSDLRYGIDYDFIVESFLCEYKLDVKKLKTLQLQYSTTTNPTEKASIENEFRSLYPECLESNIAKANIPETILKKAYFVQSPKSSNGLPAVHYSLKEKMLSDLRATRGKVKKDMKAAALAHDSVSETRFNAKQLAIKVVCNSEYGAANNEYFAHYDPDVASAVTRGARRLINFLTTNLESDKLFVDQKFLDEFKPQIKNLSTIECINIEKLSPNELTNLITERRHCIRRLFDDSYNLIQNNVFRINIKPSIVCYQDTDSNYYKNEYIADYYTKCGDKFVCDPETIDKCMHSMLAHNELLGAYIKYSIARRPYELGFEGAFIVCRYLNRKKKYYGIKWGDDAELRLTEKFEDTPQAYDPETGFLINDYMPFWQPKKTVVPQPNGDYIFIDADKLLHQGVNYLDYVHDYDVKCTGVDLARRDQYPFINFFHIVVLQKDLRIMKYDGDGDWSTFSKTEPMKSLIDNVIETFHQTILQYQSIANLETSSLPSYSFSITDFAKNSAYKQGKQGTVPQIVKRLRKEGKEKYIPGIGERMLFITLLDEATKENRANGRAQETNKGDCSYVVDEVLDMLHKEHPEEDFNTRKATTPAKDLTYDNYINACAICLLDIKRYLNWLCKSMALYIVGDEFPDEIKRIDEGELEPKAAGALISKLQEKIAKSYVNKYFPHDKKYAQELRNDERRKTKIKITSNRSALTKRYPDIDFDNLTLSQYHHILSDLNRNLSDYEDLLKYHVDVYKHLNTDKFFIPKYKNEQKQMIYDKYKKNLPKLKKTIGDINVRINNIKECLLALENVEKQIKLDPKRLENLQRIEDEQNEALDFVN